MITAEQEREWIESRGLSVAYDWKDAAEFEARVAEKLMSFQGCRKNDIVHNLCTEWIKDEEGRDVRISVCPKGRDIDGCPSKDMDTCILRIVRLAVESKMEKEKMR